MKKQVYPEPTIGALILNKNDYMLLCKSPKFSNKFIIPGGHIEVGETFEEALKREVLEETRLLVEPVELLAFFNAVFPEDFFERRHFIFIDFLCRLVEGNVQVDNRELTEAVWITPEKALQELDLEKYTKETIERYLNKKKRCNSNV